MLYPLNTSMEQIANVNNRYLLTAEEVKLFLALIEEKNITANLNGKQLNYTIQVLVILLEYHEKVDLFH